MSNAAVAAALATRLAALSLPTEWENSPFTPVDGQVYVAELLLPSGTFSVGVSLQSADQLNGIYQVLVYAPLGETKGAGNVVADQIEAQFYKGLTLTASGIKTTILRASRNPSFASGNRWVTPISIYYRAIA